MRDPCLTYTRTTAASEQSPRSQLRLPVSSRTLYVCTMHDARGVAMQYSHTAQSVRQANITGKPQGLPICHVMTCLATESEI